MKNPEELNNDELLLVLNILKEVNHQDPKYLDVYVGDVIYAQRITNKLWIPKQYRNSTRNTMYLLDFYCEYGFLDKVNDVGQYKVTGFGLRFLRENV